MSNSINQEQRAFIAWNILTECAEKGEKITYKKLTDKMGLHHRAVRYFLEVIQSYCLEQNYPPLTILAINSSTGEQGSGFIAWNRDDLDNGFESVFNYNWKAIGNPFSFARNGETILALSRQLKSGSISAEELYLIVKVRGQLQSIFRNNILEIYKRKCSFCGFSIMQALEAVHIKPWENCTRDEKLDFTNGILLCSIHHNLFDKKILTLSDDYIITGDAQRFAGNKYNKIFTTDLIGKKITLPASAEYYPSLKYISYHRNNGAVALS